MPYELISRFSGLCMLVMGCAVFYPGWLLLHRCIHLMRTGVLTTGYIKGRKRVQFVTARGERLTFRCSPLSASHFHGKFAPVLYDVEQPGIAYLATPFALSFDPINQLSLGTGWSLWGLSLLPGPNWLPGIELFLGANLLGFVVAVAGLYICRRAVKARIEATQTMEQPSFGKRYLEQE